MLSPSFTSISPVPDTDALESFFSAFTFTLVVSLVSVTEYSNVSLLNSGDNVAPSTLNDFKLLSEFLGLTGAGFTTFILHDPLLELADSHVSVATSVFATFTYALPRAIVLNL